MVRKEFNVKCNNCGGEDFSVIFPAIDNELKSNQKFSAAKAVPSKDQIAKCNECGLVMVNPQPLEEEVVKGYAEGHEQGYVSQEKQRMVTFKKCLKEVEKFCDKGKILDMGCASGFFVKVAEDAGWQATGVEPNQWMVNWGRKKYGINLKQGTLKDVKGGFDVITMWDVLEHTSNPKQQLRLANEKLVEGGYLFVNIPDFGSIFSKILKRKWWFVLSNHLYYFTPRTLTEMLQKTGFKLVKHKRHWQSLNYDYLVEMFNHLAGKGVGRYFYKFLKLLSKIGLKNLNIKYWAGQTLFIARKK